MERVARAPKIDSEYISANQPRYLQFKHCNNEADHTFFMSEIRTKPATKLNDNYFQKSIDSITNLIDN